jgi:phage terminase large subunit
LKKGAYLDAKRIWSESPTYRAWFGKPNESDRIFTAANGSIIEFTSYQDEQDAKSGKRDYLFVNEANGIPYDIYWQLAIRTKYKIFLDYNPNARFWVHDLLMGRDDVEVIYSDHRNNDFLTDEQHAAIEGIEDEELWKVYARGKTGKLTGLILQNWDLVERMPPPSERKWTATGMDFGFMNDPTAIEQVCMAHGDLWVDELCYETGMMNNEIASRLKENGYGRGDLVVADSAEMKSIAEIKNMGLWVVPCVKGADSIVHGLDILRRYKIHFTRRSVGIREEALKYKWLVDRDGRTTNKPIDAFNHAIDALRYVASAKLSIRRTGTARAHFNELG